MPTVRLVQRPDGVAEARRAVDLHEGGPAPRPCVPIAHHDRDCLVQRQHVVHGRIVAERVEEALLDGPRVAEHVIQAVGKKLLDDRRSARLLHGCGLSAAAAGYQPYRVRPLSSTSTIFLPVR